MSHISLLRHETNVQNSTKTPQKCIVEKKSTLTLTFDPFSIVKKLLWGQFFVYSVSTWNDLENKKASLKQLIIGWLDK